ncbi:MAG TPA: hypothetical protein VH500_18880 [Nitrososphaeraceae archaeon]
MPKRLVNREELGRWIAQTSDTISMITESNYVIRSTSGDNTHTVNAINSGWNIHVSSMCYDGNCPESGSMSCS